MLNRLREDQNEIDVWIYSGCLENPQAQLREKPDVAAPTNVAA
jgi:hypothetical protein